MISSQSKLLKFQDGLNRNVVARMVGKSIINSQSKVLYFLDGLSKNIVGKHYDRKPIYNVVFSALISVQTLFKGLQKKLRWVDNPYCCILKMARANLSLQG